MRNSDFGLDEMAYLGKGERQEETDKKTPSTPLLAQNEQRTGQSSEPTLPRNSDGY